MRNNVRVFFLLSFVILFLNSVLPSQIRESGVIQGNVTDTEGAPLPGVTVTLESPSYIGGTHTRVTDARGFYQFPSLTIGVYKITAELTGFNKMIREGIQVHANLTLTVDFKMPQATLEKEVIVKANTPTVDIKSSKSAAVIMTDQLLLSTPNAAKDFSVLMNQAPGGDFYSAYGAGYASPNRYQLDGIDISDPVWGGLSYFTFDFNTIKEATVQALGLPAEYGHFTGTVQTTVTKSGSNKFSSLLEFRYNGRNWNSQNMGDIPASEFYDPSMKNQKFSTPKYFDLSGQLGGKIIEDKLWFFVSAQYDQTTQYPLGTTVQPKYWTPKFFGKLTYELNSKNRFNLELDRYNARGTHILAGPSMPPNVDLDNYMPGWYTNLSWTSTFSGTTFLDAKFGFKYEASGQIPSNGIDISGHYDIGTGQMSGNYDSWMRDKGWTYDSNLQLSHYVPEFIKGSHDIKLGTELLHYKIVTAGGTSGNVRYTDYFGQPYQKYYSPPYNYDHYAFLYDAFAQDTWSITKKLTINIGLRYDHYWYRIPSADRGTVYNNGNISPRVGLNFDPWGDRKNVFRVHYGHYYEIINRNQFMDFEDRYPESITSTWNGAEYVETSRYRYIPSSVTLASNLSQPFIREFILGYERELFKDASLGITFYDRTIGQAFQIVNMAAQYAPVTIINPGPDGIVGTADDQGPMQAWDNINPGDTSYSMINPKAGNPPWLTTDLKWYARGLEFIFTKKFSNRWQMIASYNYTRSKGNTSGAMASIWDPNSLVNGYGEQGGYYAQPHQFKIQGNVILPVVDISLGTYVQIMSGPDMSPYFSAILPNGYAYFRAAPPGAIKGPTRKTIDLKVEKIFRVKGGVQLQAALDIYNLTNESVGLWNRDTTYGPYYGKLYSVMDPRTFRISLRFIY